MEGKYCGAFYDDLVAADASLVIKFCPNCKNLGNNILVSLHIHKGITLINNQLLSF
jgi:hypothetical protein